MPLDPVAAAPPAPPRWLFPVLWAMLAAGLLAAGYSASLRMAADAHYRDLVLLVDWQELSGLADPAGPALSSPANREAPWTLLKALPGAYLCYGEETVGSLLASGILKPAQFVGSGPTYEVVLPRYASDLARGAARHGYPFQQDAASGGALLIQFPALYGEDLSNLPVCWREDVISQARSRGVPLILRPGGSEFMNGAAIQATLAFCRDQPLMLFQGTQVIGYPSGLDAVAEQLRRQQQQYGWVEFDEQDGGAQLAARLAPANLVRVHSIAQDEMQNYDVDSAVDRYLRAARERDIRCLYLRPFVRGKEVARLASGAEEPGGYAASLLQLNERYFGQLASKLRDNGFNIAAKAQTLTAGPGRWIRLPIMLAVCGGILWLLALWFPAIPGTWWSWLVGLSFVGSLGGLASSPVFSLGLLKGAIVFPLLGLWLGWTLYQRRSAELPPAAPPRLGWALVALLAASLCSFAGGLLIHGGLWDARTMLKVGQFHGVSVALALPVLLFAAYAWQGESLQASWDRGRRALAPFWTRFLALWTSPVRYGDVAFLLLAAGVLALVVLRSGNDSGVGPLDFEKLFRGGLEHLFSVRPRTKELIGHPLLVLFFLSLPWRNRVTALLGLAGLLGQVSILNTFCHLHTPLALTLHREALGLGLGLLSSILWGTVALAVAWVWGPASSAHPGAPGRGNPA
jgi:hypothetical protein